MLTARRTFNSCLLTIFALVLLVVLMLVVSTYSAEAQVEEASGIVNDLTDAAERLGASSVALIAVILVLGAIVVFFVMVVYRGMGPLLETLETLSRSRDELQRQSTQERALLADITARTADVLTTLETRADAETSRISAVDQLRKTAHDEHETTRASISTILNRIDEILKTISSIESTRQTGQDVVEKTLSQIILELTGLRKDVTELKELNEPKPIPPPVPVRSDSSED